MSTRCDSVAQPGFPPGPSGRPARLRCLQFQPVFPTTRGAEVERLASGARTMLQHVGILTCNRRGMRTSWWSTLQVWQPKAYLPRARPVRITKGDRGRAVQAPFVPLPSPACSSNKHRTSPVTFLVLHHKRVVRFSVKARPNRLTDDVASSAFGFRRQRIVEFLTADASIERNSTSHPRAGGLRQADVGCSSMSQSRQPTTPHGPPAASAESANRFAYC